jgi:8-oxo-dGTP diphosphatase
VQRELEPFAGSWALPGGFVHMNESLEEAARRELVEESGARDIYLEQLFTFGEVDRDPRGRVVTVAYYALVRMSEQTLRAATDARQAEWFPVSRKPRLAFDHSLILQCALDRLRAKIRYQPVGFELLPPVFPLRELQHLYEVILDRELDKRNFRKKILEMGIVEEAGMESGVAHRAAQLYRFRKDRYERLPRKGVNFQL